MAVLYGTYNSQRGASPPGNVDGTAHGGRVRVYEEKITLATQTTADTIEIAYPRLGEMFLYGVLLSTVTLGAAATVAIGIAGTTGKYRTAAIFTTADTPVFFGNAAAAGVKLAAAEVVFITIAVASLPAAGTLNTQMFFAAA